eukprot:TRINITY_DN37360_c0_g1_i12.p1 TRINITY_DN37360_c0_g1~~TRINITY_DN37360_c0_g1_i12.p1  ORF type:complete len:138 (-),score=30.01 TRINITY_DN37360_c0_g1_i12:16-429(-)
MAVYSMTGYASASTGTSATGENASESGHGPSAGVVVDLRSVNSRFLDIAFRMPDEMRALEPALRELITGQLRRGKIELRLATRDDASTAWPQPQTDQLHTLSRLESTVQSWLPKAPPQIGRAVQQECRDRSRMPSSA